MVTSSGQQILNGLDEVRKRFPTEKAIRIITPQEAQEFFRPLRSQFSPLHLTDLERKDFKLAESEDTEVSVGRTDTDGAALRVNGVNWLISDSPQFMPHYYHFVAQMLLAMWRTYSSLDLYIIENGRTTLPPPNKLFMTHISAHQWRDGAGLNAFILRGAFPGIGMEYKEDWEDRANTNIPFVFDRVLIADRAASNNGRGYKATHRSALDPFFELDGSPNFWSTVRNNVLDFSHLRLAAEWINAPDPGRLGERMAYVITYVSRQEWGRRSLRRDDHGQLVGELMLLRDQYGYEVNVISAEKLSKAEQILLAGRTTVRLLW